jgi:hypothetical protein
MADVAFAESSLKGISQMTQHFGGGEGPPSSGAVLRQPHHPVLQGIRGTCVSQRIHTVIPFDRNPSLLLVAAKKSRVFYMYWPLQNHKYITLIE